MKRRISLFPPVEIPSILAPFTEQRLGGSGCKLQSWAVSARKSPPLHGFGTSGMCHLTLCLRVLPWKLGVIPAPAS